MLTYSKGQPISLNLSLILSDGTNDKTANVRYELYNPNKIIIASNTVSFDPILEAYIDVIQPWFNQEDGIHYVKWYVSNTKEDFPIFVIEEIYIDTIEEKVSKILGLVHENIVIDNADYDVYDNLVSARLRIYSDAASIGTENNILGTYKITAQPNGAGKFLYWKQEAI